MLLPPASQLVAVRSFPGWPNPPATSSSTIVKIVSSLNKNIADLEIVAQINHWRGQQETPRNVLLISGILILDLSFGDGAEATGCVDGATAMDDGSDVTYVLHVGVCQFKQ